MIVCLEGPDGAGKSTLVNYLMTVHHMKMIHSSSETKNDLEYHLDLLKEDNVVLDRANLGEIVYPAVYNRERKMDWEEQLIFMRECEKKGVTYIIFYASDFNTLKDRLFKRGDTQQVLDNAEKINLCFKLLATLFEEMFPGTVCSLDISKELDQIDFLRKLWRKENETVRKTKKRISMDRPIL